MHAGKVAPQNSQSNFILAKYSHKSTGAKKIIFFE